MPKAPATPRKGRAGREGEERSGVPKDYIFKTVALPEDTDGRKPLRDWIHATGKNPREVRDAVKQYLAGKR